MNQTTPKHSWYILCLYVKVSSSQNQKKKKKTKQTKTKKGGKSFLLKAQACSYKLEQHKFNITTIQKLREELYLYV